MWDLRRARRRQGQHRINCLRVARGAQFLGNVLIAQQPCDSRQRFEVIGARAFRRQQQEHQVDRLAVHRLEIDRALEAGKKPEQLFQLGKLAVRDGDAIADGGGSQFFALQQHLENRAFVLPGQDGGPRRQFLQRLLLAVDLQRRENRLGCDQIGNRHGAFRGEFNRQVTNVLQRGGVSKMKWRVYTRVPFGGLLLQRKTGANSCEAVSGPYPKGGGP